MPNFIIKNHHCFLALLFFGLTACSSIPSQQASNSLDAKIQQTRVILVGETHTDYGHHLNQLALIKKSHKKWGGVSRALARQRWSLSDDDPKGEMQSSISIGLEMVQQPFQEYLDKYIAGEITELEMLRGVEWYSRWRYDFRLYRPIFDYAKKHKIPLIALNIPRELTKRVSKVGLKGLNPEERKQLPAFIDQSNTEYRARLREVFGMHSHGKTINESGFNKFVDAQLAWDEGMAFAASNYLYKHPKRRMVILAGSGHLINREGIPSRLDRQLKLPTKQRSLVVLSHSDEKYTSKEADFSLPTNPTQLPAAGQIGIGMKKGNSGVQISSISKTGAAFKAGLKQGDLILSLDSSVIKKPSDVYLWLLDKKPDEMIKAVIRRNNKTFSKSFPLGSSLKE